MAEETREFQEFMQAWTDKTIIAHGVDGDKGVSRETLLKNRARELNTMARKRGFLPQLSTRANQHGDVRGYISSLYRKVEDSPPPQFVPTQLNG
jgi:hypothetical protein